MIRDTVYGLMFAAAGRLAGLPTEDKAYDLRTTMHSNQQGRPTMPGLRSAAQLTPLVLRPLEKK